MPLTPTTHLTSFTRPLPSASTFAFPPRPSPLFPQPPTHITLPPHSDLSTQLHWHVTHTEYLRILSGAALVTINGRSRVVTPADGVLEVPRYARHEWMRFDRPSGLLGAEQRGAQERGIREMGGEEVQRLRGVRLVVEEWTEPGDGEKEVFFRNLFSTFAEERYQGWGRGWLAVVQVMVVMWELDNFVVMLDYGGWRGGWRGLVEEGVTYGVMGAVWLLGRALGCRGVNREYTPEQLMRSWEKGRGDRKKRRKEL